MKYYDNMIKTGQLMANEIEEIIRGERIKIERRHGVALREVTRQDASFGGEHHMRVVWEVIEPSSELTPYDRPQPAGQPLDPLTAKCQRQARRDAAFTREQQQVIGEILETWWAQKMAGIETQKVIEATETLPRDLADLAARVAALEVPREQAIDEALENDALERSLYEDPT